MMAERFTFHRAELALDFMGSLEGKGLFDASSGMFLAAPRRTGKSTFLREDLVPQMQKNGWVTVYVDLWSDQSRDPALLIADALKESIKGATLADAFSYLSEKSQRPIALIVDEAQHALNTQAGITAMFAIKAARDRLKNKLFLVFTGSHRDKLAHLVLKKDQPFFGAQIISFPLLGRSFTDAYTAWVNQQLVSKNHFTGEDMFYAFELVGHRPEMLKVIIQEIALDYGAAPDLGSILKDQAQSFRKQIWSDIESDFASLTDLQKAILEVMIAKGKDFSPFTEDSMMVYRTLLNRDDLGAPQIQAALEGLRERNLVWKSARGAYALEDASLSQWFSQSKSHHAKA